MSKFCNNCGAMMNDADMVCSSCGAPYAAQAAQNGFDPFATNSAPVQNAGYADPAQPMAPAAPANKSADLIKKYLPIGVGAVAVIVVLVIIIACAGGGYKKAMKKYVEGIFSDDAETVAKYMSIMANDGDEPEADDVEDGVEWLTALFEDEYGELKSVKVKVTKVDKYDKDEKEDFVEDYCGDDVDPDDIKKIYEVDADLIIKGKDDEMDEDDTEDITFYVSKEKGGWKVISIDGLI